MQQPMTDDTRGALADLAVLAAVAAGVYALATRPAWRRAVWRALAFGLFTAAPRFLWAETRQAWELAGRARGGSRL